MSGSLVNRVLRLVADQPEGITGAKVCAAFPVIQPRTVAAILGTLYRAGAITVDGSGWIATRLGGVLARAPRPPRWGRIRYTTDPTPTR